MGRGGIGHQVVFTDTTGHLVQVDLPTGKMILRGFFEEDKLLVYEDNPIFDWTIIDDHKVIAGLSCTKAFTQFRGRTYEAWFAPSIPISAGPWKFNGLLGLITVVNDKEGAVQIQLMRFQNVLKEDLAIQIEQINSSLLEFNELADQAWEAEWHKNNALIAKLQAEFPDVEMSNNGAPRNRPATELEYE